MKVVGVLIGLVCCIPFLGWAAVRGYDAIIFDRELGGHLKRAADANSIELAKQELEIVVKQMEVWKMTDGYTSIVYTTPNEDVKFWHINIKACLTQINELPPDAKQGEKDLVLMKLRQTLLDHKGGQETVTEPTGISIYPYNVGMCLWFWVSLVIGVVGIIIGCGCCLQDN
jgi:hypothetical protein